MVLKERTNVDDTPRELTGRGVKIPAPDHDIAPVGMSVEEEAEPVTLLSLADANLDGDERAGIDRLPSVLGSIRSEAGWR